MARQAVNPGIGRGNGVRESNKQCTCTDCGTVFFAKRSDAKRCVACNAKRDRAHRQRSRPQRNLGARAFMCINCGASFSALRILQRCEDCQRVHSNHLASTRELEKRKPCIDCGELVYRRTALRCHTCEGKRRATEGIQRGENNSNWKGGRTLHHGYVRVRNSDPKGKPRYIGEHILVWEAAHGPVPKNWDVHHLNGVKDDNRLENLFAMSKSQHHSNHHNHYEERIRILEARIRGCGELTIPGAIPQKGTQHG